MISKIKFIPSRIFLQIEIAVFNLIAQGKKIVRPNTGDQHRMHQNTMFLNIYLKTLS